MADFAFTVNALRERLIAEFTALPLYWPNGDRDPVRDGAIDGFVFSEARLVSEGAVTLGFDTERLHRDLGEFVVTVYVPTGSRIGAAETHAETIRRAFGPNSVPDVRITRRLIGQGVAVDGPLGRWYALAVVIEYQSDRME